jgi:hypothetical protein
VIYNYEIRENIEPGAPGAGAMGLRKLYAAPSNPKRWFSHCIKFDIAFLPFNTKF